MFECKICGFKGENKSGGSHLYWKHKIDKTEYYSKYREDLEFTRKDVLVDLYYNKKMSIKQIVELYEEKYSMSSLKDTILKLFKYYDLNLRSVSDAQKLFIDRSGGVWNKNETKNSNDSVRVYAEKKKELYRDLHNTYEKMPLSSLIETFGLPDGSTVKKIIKKRIINEKQDGRCLICENLFKGMNKRNIHIHHIDRNHSNNDEENLSVLCIRCHMLINGHKHRIKEIDEYNTFTLLSENIDTVRKILDDKIKKQNVKRGEGAVYYNKIKKTECFLCSEKESKFHVHHLDGNSENNDKNNLCCLCHSCHSKVTGMAIMVNSKKELKEEFFSFEGAKCLIENKARTKVNELNIKEFIKLNS